MQCPLRPLTICLAACLLLAGCSGSQENDKPDISLKKVSGKRLNALMGDYLSYLDEGRLEIATPEGWKPLPRDTRNYVVGFYRRKKSDYPRILVTVEKSKADQFRDLTAKNVADFTKRMTAQFHTQEKILIELPRPMILGDRPCARYVIAGKTRTVRLERQVLITLVKGRTYTIELHVYSKEELLENRDAAYAVAASMKFSERDEDDAKDGPPDKKKETDG